jgi:hypothetical protein
VGKPGNPPTVASQEMWQIWIRQQPHSEVLLELPIVRVPYIHDSINFNKYQDNLPTWGNELRITSYASRDGLLRISVDIDIKALMTLYLGSEWSATKC